VTRQKTICVTAAVSLSTLLACGEDAQLASRALSKLNTADATLVSCSGGALSQFRGPTAQCAYQYGVTLAGVSWPSSCSDAAQAVVNDISKVGQDVPGTPEAAADNARLAADQGILHTDLIAATQ